MDPMVVDVLVCLDRDQCSDKTLLADAGGAEVKEIIDYQAAEDPFPYSMSYIRDISVCLPFYSEVIQSSRCTLMAKWLLGDFGVRLLVRTSTYWRKHKSENIYCKAAAFSEATIDANDELFWGLLSLSGFDPRRTAELSKLSPELVGFRLMGVPLTMCILLSTNKGTLT